MKRNARLELTTGQQESLNGDTYQSLEARINGKLVFERHYQNQIFADNGIWADSEPINDESKELRERLEQLERENWPASYSLRTADGGEKPQRLNYYLESRLQRLGMPNEGLQ